MDEKKEKLYIQKIRFLGNYTNLDSAYWEEHLVIKTENKRLENMLNQMLKYQ